MTLDYDSETHIRDLEAIIDEFTGWFMQVVRRLFYAVDEDDQRPLEQPDSFHAWLKIAEAHKTIAPEILDGITRLHNDVLQISHQLQVDTKKQRMLPVYNDFDQLAAFFEEFIHTLRRIMSEHQAGESGIDALTGLRTREMFFKDIRRETDRLARQGKAFSIAIVQIDHFDQLRAGFQPQQMDECIKLVSAMIKKTLRSFDDAYRMDDNMFVLSLKQTSVGGGMSALHRLKAELAKQKNTYNFGDCALELTLSSCIAEPLPEDDVRQLLNNMKHDLDQQAGQDGVVLEYFEMSPLQRFIKEGQEQPPA